MTAIKIVSEPPGPKARKVAAETTKVLSPSISRFYPLVIESAHDCLIRDVDGNQFIDFNSGIGVLNVGSTNDKVVSAAKEQLDKFTHYSYTDFYYDNINDLAEKLISIYPGKSPGAQVFYGNSGTEAIEAAFKLARINTGRPRMLAYTGSFHGRTMGAVSLTGSKITQMKGVFPLVPGVEHVPFPYCYRCPLKLEHPSCALACVDYIEEQYFEKFVPPEEVAALFMEAIQGEGGYVPMPDDYPKALFKLLKKYGILVVADEVQSGIGRTGKWFAVDHYGVQPDMVAVAKALGGGLPIGALIGKEGVMTWKPGQHASTFGGNPVSAAAGLAVLSFIEEENLLVNARKQGQYMMKIFNEWKEKYEIVGDVRGKGLMIGIELVTDKKSKDYGVKQVQEVLEKTWKKGVLLISCGRSTLRIVPPLTITKPIVDEALAVIEDAIKEVNASSSKKKRI